MNIDATASEIARYWMDRAEDRGINSVCHEGLTEDIAAALLAARNEALEEAARTADGCFMGRAGAAIRALKERT